MSDRRTRLNPLRVPETQTDYAAVPLLRRSSVCSGILLAHVAVIMLGVVPGLGALTFIGLLVVCVAVLTGPVYYAKLQTDGTLRQWSRSNRVAAVIVLLLFVAGNAYAMLQAVAGPLRL